MKTTTLIKIEKIDSAPFSTEHNELDYSLLPELNSYLKDNELEAIETISKEMSLIITYLKKSFYYKKEKIEKDIEHSMYEIINCECGHECPVDFAIMIDDNWICSNCYIEELKSTQQ